MVDHYEKQPKTWLSKLWKYKAPKVIGASLEPRFVSFEEGRMIILKYFNEVYFRDYGVFKSTTSNGCPKQQFNSEVTWEMDLFNLDGIDLQNYEDVKIKGWGEQVTMQFIFSIFDLNLEEGQSPNQLLVTMQINADDLGDFISELRAQFELAHIDHVELYIN